MDGHASDAGREAVRHRAARAMVGVLLAAALPLRSQPITIDTAVFHSAEVSAAVSAPAGRTILVTRTRGYPAVNGVQAYPSACQVVQFDPAEVLGPPVICAGPTDATTALRTRDAAALYVAGGAGMLVSGLPRPLLAKLALPLGPPGAWQLTPAPATPLPNQIDRLVELATGVVVASGPREQAGESVVLRIDGVSGAAAAVLVVAGPISALAATSDGGVLVGGNFTFEVGGQPRRGLLKLQPGSLEVDPAYAAGPGVALSAIAAAADGRAYVARGDDHRVLRLDASGAVDPGWTVVADGEVRAIAVDAAQRVYPAGAFSAVNGEPRRGIARILPQAGAEVDAGWLPEPLGGTVTGLQVDADSITLTGAISAPSSHQAGVVRFALATAMPPPAAARIRVGDTRSSGPTRMVERVFPTGDGELLVVGPFGMTARRVVPGVVRIDRFGNERTAWTPALRGRVFAAASGSDGSVILSGRLARPSEAASWQAVRVAGPDATLDAGWTVVAQNGPPEALAVQAPWVYLLGAFSAINAAPAAIASRVSLAAPATVDAGYSPAVSCCVLAIYRAILPQPDGSELINIAGAGSIDFDPPPPPGPPVQALQRLQPQAAGPSTLVPFGPFLDASLADVQNVLVDGRGDRYLLGRLRSAADPTRLGIVRMFADGTFDPSMANFSAECRPYGPGAIGADGLLYLACEAPGGGSFPTRRVLRLVPGTGEIDRDWFPQASFPPFAAPTHLAAAGDRIVVVFEQEEGGPLSLVSLATVARPLFADGMEPATGP